MLKKSKLLKVLLPIVLILGIRQVYRFVVTKNADAIVRMGVQGTKNMFHTPYEYYAIGSAFSAECQSG